MKLTKSARMELQQQAAASDASPIPDAFNLETGSFLFVDLTSF